MHKQSRNCIVVLGMHRSGTSSLTRLISFAGAKLPNTLLKTRAGNESGHWESQKFVNYNDEFLKDLGQSWHDWKPLNIEKEQSAKFVKQTQALIKQEYADENFIVLKDPRFCRYPHLLAQALTELGFSVKFSIITRNPLEVSGSLMQRNRFSEVHSNLLWLRYVLDAEYLTRGYDRAFVSFDHIIRDSKACLVRLANHLNITWPNSLQTAEQKAAQFINPALKHHNESGLSTEVYNLTGSWFDETYQILQNASLPQNKDVDRRELDRIRSQLNEATSSLIPLVDIEQSTYVAVVDLNNQIKHLESEKKNLIEARNQDVKAYKKERQKFVANVEQRDRDIEALKEEQTHLTHAVALRENDVKILKKQSSSLKRSVTIKNKKLEKLNSEHMTLGHTVRVQEDNITELERAVAQETAQSAYKSEQINEILNSRSWRLLSLPRKLSTLWRNKTLYLVKLLGRKGVKNLDTGSTDLSSTLKAAILARRDLAAPRSEVLHSKWHTALLGVENNIADADLPNITISAVTFNSEKWLQNFFMSIIHLDYPSHKITLHFVDNGSKDQSVESINSFIATHKHQYRNMEIFSRPNKGYGVGNDFGIRQSNDDFVLVTNVDTEFYTDSLKKVVTVAVNDTADVACWEFRQTPYEHPKFYDPITFLTNWTSHACVLIRKKAYLDVGGYDHKIFMYGEDVELSYRFRAYGWKLKYVPSAVIKHYVDLEDSTVRPHQLSGSVSANILLRYRFGSYSDILAGEALFAAVKANETDPIRMKAWGQVNKIVNKNRWHFFRKRKRRTKAHFPFHEFDYDLARPGASVEVTPFKDLQSKTLPKVSVITRTHGKAREHLENVIASVLNQTYKNIEHIIVEDRTDDGQNIVAPLTAKYGNRVKYIKSDGRGRSYCGNYGALQATGDYVCWLDNDDVFFADHIETLVAGLCRTPGAVCSYALAWEALSETKNEQISERQFVLPELHNQPYDKQRFLKENFIPIQAIIFEKNLFDVHGGFRESFSQLEDWNLWTRYAQLGPFAFTPKVTSFYRTPLDSKLRQNRHELLHEAYETVKKANLDDIAKIQKTLKTNVSLQKARKKS